MEAICKTRKNFEFGAKMAFDDIESGSIVFLARDQFWLRNKYWFELSSAKFCFIIYQFDQNFSFAPDHANGSNKG